jgi:hypothetical protein
MTQEVTLQECPFCHALQPPGYAACAHCGEPAPADPGEELAEQELESGWRRVEP